MTADVVIVEYIEVQRAPAPLLVDYHLAPEEVTEALPDPYESVWEVVVEDRGGCRAREERSWR